MACADVVEGVVTLFRGLIDPARMALAKGAACAVLARQANGETFDRKRSKGQRLGRSPIEPFARFEHVFLGVQLAGNGFVQIKAFGHAG